MGSDSLFAKCKNCGETISKSTKACPKCGAKQKKLSKIHWIGIILFSFFLIIIISASGNNKQNDSSKDSQNITKNETNIQHNDNKPNDEISFINLIEKYRTLFIDAKNELQQSILRDKRKANLANSLNSRTIDSWVGKISQLETNSEGNAILSVKISPYIEIKTWNNAISDLASDTLIEKETPLYNDLINLARGKKVKFSGHFLSSQEDYIEEQSVTIRGSMKNPEFVFKFISIEQIN